MTYSQCTQTDCSGVIKKGKIVDNAGELVGTQLTALALHFLSIYVCMRCEGASSSTAALTSDRCISFHWRDSGHPVVAALVAVVGLGYLQALYFRICSLGILIT